ncbi:hypothetical protein Trydic_g22269 [Trypoxylus dichotomus]
MKFNQTILKNDEENQPKPGKMLNKYNGKIWKQIFYLPAEPVWYYSIIVLNYTTVVGHLIVSANQDCMSEKMKDLNLLIIFNVMDTIYLVDIILVMLSLYIPNLNLPDINISARPLPIIVTEILSVIPLQLILPKINKLVNLFNTEQVYCVLRLNSTFRVIRIVYFYNQVNTQITAKVFMKVLQLLSYMIFVIVIFYSTYCNTYCQIYGCEQTYCNRSNITLMIEKSIGLGYDATQTNLAWEIIGTVAQVIVFYCIITVAMAHVTIGIIASYRHQIKYLDCSNVLIAQLKKLDLPRTIINKVIDYFDIIWAKTKGYSTDQSYWSFLHPSMRNELMIDVSWPALQHSHLFRSMDFNYLRYLSNFIQIEFMLPGQHLFTKGEWKSKMVYIATGTIHLISNEDGESALISLCAGTCIGESCLVIDYKSLNNVVCKTFCEFHILKRIDFLRSCVKYAQEFRECQNVIFVRYKNASTLNNISRIAKSKLRTQRKTVDIYTLLWVKNTLHKLMAIDEESTHRHEFQNIYFINEVNEEDFNKLSFTARYLDMLVVGERIEVDTDTVFVKINFPCILQPKSVIGIIWEILIIMVTLTLSFIIPRMSFILMDQPVWYYPLVCLVTYIYWLDIYVQLSTSIRSKHQVVTKISKIAKVKMQTFGLWADIISCIPCEIFVSIISKENTPQINAILHFNR